jgi:RsiW-degrading membrane proteinase PrsW (M82 family)
MIEAERYLQQRNTSPPPDLPPVAHQPSPPPHSVPLPTANGQRASHSPKWLPVILASGMFGVVSALLSQSGYFVLGALSSILVAPISEEILKIAVPIMILEHKTRTIQNRSDLLRLAAGSGLVFAIAENLLYMIGYSMSPGVLAWRWLACTGMHVGASSLAGVGLMRAFDRASRTGEPPRYVWEWPWLLAAIGIHFAFNFLVTLAS